MANSAFRQHLGISMTVESCGVIFSATLTENMGGETVTVNVRCIANEYPSPYEFTRAALRNKRGPHCDLARAMFAAWDKLYPLTKL